MAAERARSGAGIESSWGLGSLSKFVHLLGVLNAQFQKQLLVLNSEFRMKKLWMVESVGVHMLRKHLSCLILTLQPRWWINYLMNIHKHIHKYSPKDQYLRAPLAPSGHIHCIFHITINVLWISDSKWLTRIMSRGQRARWWTFNLHMSCTLLFK